MADLKISQLTAATAPLAGTEVLPIVQSGATVQVSVANLTAGRAVSATQVTLTTGNLIVANGQGIDFSATPGTGTSELFADYEEGTWTPTGNGVTLTVNSASYTKIGRQVTVTYDVTFPITSDTGQARVASLPFTPGFVGGGSIGYCESSSVQRTVNDTGTSLYFVNNTAGTTYATNLQCTGARIWGTHTYIV